MTNETREYVSKIIRKIASNSPDHEDLVQDVLLLAHRKTTQLRTGPAFKSWLYMVARTVVSDYYRAPAAKTTKLMHSDEDMVHPTYEVDPSARIQVAEIMSRLDGLNAQMFWQYYAEGMTEGEIAKYHGVSLPAAKARIHRARKHVANP